MIVLVFCVGCKKQSEACWLIRLKIYNLTLPESIGLKVVGTQESPIECSRRIWTSLPVPCGHWLPHSNFCLLLHMALPPCVLPTLLWTLVILSTKSPFPITFISTASRVVFFFFKVESSFKPLHGTNCSPMCKDHFKACSCYCH